MGQYQFFSNRYIIPVPLDIFKLEYRSNDIESIFYF